MPEGDTIHRLAAAIRPDLAGQVLERAELREVGTLRGLVGHAVEGVEAQGKHLLIRVEGGWSLRTHLGMYGDLHRYRRGERWQRPRRSAVLILATAGVELLWIEPAQAELLPTRLLGVHPRLSRLGPDLLSAGPDLEAVARRAAACAELRGPTHTIGELLLDQSLASGIGNIYKSEVLFVEGLAPSTPAPWLDEAALLRLYQRARELLGRNLGPGRRSTRKGEPRLWVYGRGGRPCLRCGTAILRELQGLRKRVSFWCPSCQPAPSLDLSLPQPVLLEHVERHGKVAPEKG